MHQRASSHHLAGRRLLATLAVTGVVMVAELVGGLWSGSLALLADAGHMLTDVLALLVAFAAVRLGVLPADERRTYGYRRLEILAALTNGIALVVVSATIVREAIARYLSPQPVDTTVMSVVAVIGLVANLIGLRLLGGKHSSLNVRGAFLHILGDTLSSLGVLAAAAVIAVTGWTTIDAILSVLIAAVIVISSVSLLREVIDVLLEAVPRGIDTEKVRTIIGAVPGVDSVHDLHIWSITSGMPALSAHVVVANPSTDTHVVLGDIQHRLRALFSIDHATLQIERRCAPDCGCEEYCCGELRSKA